MNIDSKIDFCNEFYLKDMSNGVFVFFLFSVTVQHHSQLFLSNLKKSEKNINNQSTCFENI